MRIDLTATPTRTSGQTALERRLQTWTVTMLVLLLAQYLFSMLVNFWAVIPDNHPRARPAEYFPGAATSVWWALGRGGWD